MSSSEADLMELDSTSSYPKNGSFFWQFSFRTKIWLAVNGGLQVRDDLDRSLVARAIYV